MLRKNLKRASSITELRNLPPIDDIFGDTLGEELSYRYFLNVRNLPMYQRAEKDLAQDLLNLLEGDSLGLNPKLWQRLGDSYLSNRDVRKFILAIYSEDEITEYLDGLKDSHPRSYQDLFSDKYREDVTTFDDDGDADYDEDLAENLNRRDFIQNVLPNLARSSFVGVGIFEGKKLGVRVPLVVLNRIKEALDDDDYGLEVQATEPSSNPALLEDLKKRYSKLLLTDDLFSSEIREISEDLIKNAIEQSNLYTGKLVNASTSSQVDNYFKTIKPPRASELFKALGGKKVLKAHLKDKIERLGINDVNEVVLDSLIGERLIKIEGTVVNFLFQKSFNIFDEVKQELKGQATEQFQKQMRSLASKFKVGIEDVKKGIGKSFTVDNLQTFISFKMVQDDPKFLAIWTTYATDKIDVNAISSNAKLFTSQEVDDQDEEDLLRLNSKGRKLLNNRVGSLFSRKMQSFFNPRLKPFLFSFLSRMIEQQAQDRLN